jgi:hypothetical protein
MTDREAIRRLTLNTGDCSAVSWLHFNHNAAIHAIVTRFFGNGPLSEKAEYDLMQRIAGRARSFKREEDSEEWLVRCAIVECNLLRTELNPDSAKSH